MLTMTNKFNAAIKSPVRTVQGKVDLYHKSGTSQYTKIATYTQDDYLKSIKIERIADEGKFFGFGVSHKVNIKLRDVNRELNITNRKDDDAAKRCFFVLYLGTGEEYCETQRFYITETNRDENTNELSVTAYDALYFGTTPIGNMKENTMANYAARVMELMKNTNNLLLWNSWNGGIVYQNCAESEFKAHTFVEGGNFEETHTCRDVLNDIAEATHTIYYIDKDDKLVFKRPSRDGEPVLTISRSDYFTLKSSSNRRLAKITHATELGDNVFAEMSINGTNQILRDNEFFAKMSVDDMTAAIECALTNLGGITINQFSCSWRGNPALEPGDKIALETKDGDTVFAYCYNDTLTYDGTFKQSSEWKYSADEEETDATPTSLGDVIKQVYAKVDRVNKEISLVVKEEDLEKLRKEVALKVNSDDVKILVQEAMGDEVNSITTTTGFTFNEEGLTIAKTTSDITTTITEDGMYIKRGNEEVLTADNEGVKAEDLHATTYLIVGVNSRFEDYDKKRRTGCFWIGGK